ncbi:glutathione peroxidase [Sphingobium sufflavum]|uniref:glutathione peroxidase n=1 Tax=Sphingobium sufflavum TaxID=1129547 RepID=UPI001F21C74C|nr:glutathione peroxidase [Sphingobium sufflavum]MCE7796972.1 glutathione peroxidase [Sphingobium sufflavum]
MTAIQDIPLKTIKGADATLGDYAGKVLLVVNVASKCGLTPQYEGLEKLYKEYQDKGLVVLGFPANDFKEQEPGTNDEIATFCTTNYGVDFPLFEKLVATGPDKHPLYAELTKAVPEKYGDAQVWRDRLKGYGIDATEDPEVLWNFEKFLVDRDGNVVGRFSPQVTPDDPALVAAIDKALG